MHTDDARPLPEWTLLDLAKLQHLPQLRRISGVSVELASTLPGEAFSFPPLLNTADLYLPCDDELLDEDDESRDSASVQRMVLRALRPCHSLTELSITLLPYNRLHLDPLQELVTLQTLRLDIALTCVKDGEWCMFKQEHMRVVQQLPNLQRLSLHECAYWEEWDENDPLGTRWLHWLCPLPHRLQQMEELDLSQQQLHLEHMQLLQRLSALTAIEPLAMYESSIPMLQAFAERLQRLSLTFTLFNDQREIDAAMVDVGTRFARGSWLLPHLASCAALTQLTLANCAFTDDDATTLCQALPRLRELRLIDVGWPSFESLSHLSLLEWLGLQLAKAYPLQFDAAHFQPLQQLRHLSLSNLPPLPDAAKNVIAALQPPSALLPALVDFWLSL